MKNNKERKVVQMSDFDDKKEPDLMELNNTLGIICAACGVGTFSSGTLIDLADIHKRPWTFVDEYSMPEEFNAHLERHASRVRVKFGEDIYCLEKVIGDDGWYQRWEIK